MAKIDFLVDTMNGAVSMMHENGLSYMLGQDVHLSPLYIEHSTGSTIIPLLEFENEVHFESKFIESRRRRDVFSVGDLIFKSGEISTDPNYLKSTDNRHDPKVKDMANYNLSLENRKRLDNPEIIEPLVMIVYDRINGVKYAVEEKKLTLSDLAGKYNPFIGKEVGLRLEEAAIRIYTMVESQGNVFIPRRKLNGKVDLGDILVDRKEDGTLEIKLTDNPTIQSQKEANIDNSQSFAMVLNAFYDSMASRKKSKSADIDVFQNLRNWITLGSLNHALAKVSGSNTISRQ